MVELGRRVDGQTFADTGDVAMLAPERLTRHAVCFGMTGSGKTGLCVTLLEELASAGVPLLVLDPKGDMANLALAFAEHRAADFEPWVDPAAAARAELSVAAFAEKVAAQWRQGLARDGIGADRVRQFTERAEVTVHTPGSSSGVPVDVLGGLGALPVGLAGDAEGIAELVASTTSALLGLVGVDADPTRDPRHVVLATLLDHTWSQGRSLALEELVLKLVDPPFDRVGVFPLEQFFARKDRMDLAMRLNTVIASPSFAAWRQGVPLDIEALLDGHGKAPVRVFSLNHLDEAQRCFFAALLLSRVVAWSRRQSGTSALRCLVYFDEVFGFLPPHPHNPPTKRPTLTLMKQARAVGVGTMLVTQNPIDVDYAAFGNAGLWLLGRLQTKQDKDRVLDGLASVAGDVDRATLSGWLDALPPRTFIVRDVNESAPYLVRSRFAISYLRGPLTRAEIGSLNQVVPAAHAAPAPAAGDDASLLPAPPPAPDGVKVRWLSPDVVFSGRLAEFFDAHAEPHRADDAIVWRPAVWAQLRLRFVDGRDIRADRDEHRLFFPLGPHEPVLVGEPMFEDGDFLRGPQPGRYEPLPAHLDEKREFTAFEKQVRDDVARGETEQFFRHKATKLASNAGERREDFEARVYAALRTLAANDQRKVLEKAERDIKRLDERRVKLIRDRDARQTDLRAKQASEVFNLGELVYGMFFGRKKSAASAVSKRGQTARASERVERADTEIVELERQMYDLEATATDDSREIENAWLRQVDDIEAIAVGLRASDVTLDAVELVWVPVSRAI